MVATIFGIFLILHGLVHLLYLGQSRKVFELQPGLIWPDGSWAFSRMVGDEGTRTMAAFFLLLAALGFAVGGLGEIFSVSWWRPLVIGAAVFSSLLYLLLWNGSSEGLDDQGGIGLLINLAIILGLFIGPGSEF